MKVAIIMRTVTDQWKVKMENCTTWTSAKANEEGRVKLTETVSAVDALVTLEQFAEPKLTSVEDLQNLRPKGKVLEIARTKTQRPHKMCQWGPLVWGPLEVLSDHGDEEEDDESTNETTEMMPASATWFVDKEDRDVLREVSETLQ